MEVSVSPQGHKQHLQINGRKILNGKQKDLWISIQEGSVADVDSALAVLKKNGVNINLRNSFGLTPLHIATWRNNIPIVRRLLAAGADPDTRDGESGWSSLHRALHFGHLAVASILLQSGASILLEDSKFRTPIDMLSGPVSQVVGSGSDLVTEVFSWGSGANYQLGTGNACIQKLPGKVESLNGLSIKLVSAAKFHSAAVGAQGEVFTWGFGRGGRLGHPDFDIHSGQAAVITPRQVTSGLGARRVKAVAAAKHHTVIATEGGEVFTWGSNREGQLGYTSIDTQPTPRRVSSLKAKILSVAAANKHTAVVSECGEIYTWGCNREGQLGYGTSNSGSNYTPRLVEYLKSKVFVKVAAAKYHTIVLGPDGEVYTWGHRFVTPKRVMVSRNLKKGGSAPLKFHRMERLHVVAIAAGMAHSMALTDDGTLFYWVSSDPDLRCQQLYSLCQKNIASISAGKYWSAAVTTTGDVYMWDGKKGTDKPPVLTRLHGAKRATSVSVGETHLLIVGSLYHPPYPVSFLPKKPQDLKPSLKHELEKFDEGFLFDDFETDGPPASMVDKADGSSVHKPAPTLKSLCEKVAAESLVEPRNAIQLLEIADSLQAPDLRKHCECIVLRNLDYIFTVATQSVANTSLEILANLEKLLDSKSSESWSFRRLPTPTATFPAIINSEEEDSEYDPMRTRSNQLKKSVLRSDQVNYDSFLHPKNNLDEGLTKQIRALRKKLQQIEMLEEKQIKGQNLDQQQLAKLKTRPELENLLVDLGVPMDMVDTKNLVSSDGKGNKKVELSKKQRKRSKPRVVTQAKNVSGFSQVDEKGISEASLDLKSFEVSKIQEDEEVKVSSEVTKDPLPLSNNTQKEIQEAPKKSSSSKKKNKKGGLSMFLSGALDDTPRESTPPPPPTPKSEGPAWGGVKLPKGSASLREIQDEQKKVQGFHINYSSNCKGKVGEIVDVNIEGRISLSSFISSNPIAVLSPNSSHAAADGEKSTPTWVAASGTPPSFSRPSLRDIQMQQGKKQQCLSHSPKTRTAGFAVTSGQGSPSDNNNVNRWFKPEIEAPSSIRSIQIEEKAIKDLKRFYSSVKIVKTQF